MSLTVRDRLFTVALERGLRQGTVNSYERLLGMCGLLDVTYVTQETVVTALWTIQSHNTRRAAIIAVRSVLGYKIKIPKSIPRRYVLATEDTYRLALMTSPHEIRGLLCMYGGLRIGEACAITSNDVQGDRLRVDKQILELTRTGDVTQIRTADTKGTAVDIVIPWWLASRLQGLTGTARPSTVRESLRRSGIKAGINLNPHQLRKYYITRLIEAGCPLELVRKQARHSDISITLTHYQQFSETDVHKYLGEENNS